jgi:hypothetical protein
MCVCVCARARACACVCVFVCVCAHACLYCLTDREGTAAAKGKECKNAQVEKRLFKIVAVVLDVS